MDQMVLLLTLLDYLKLKRSFSLCSNRSNNSIIRFIRIAFTLNAIENIHMYNRRHL